jgi:hypothetical protein
MPIIEEGVYLDDVVIEVIAFMQDCFDKLERGEEDQILADPFFERPRGKPPLTDEEIDGIISAIDSEFTHEITNYLDYHRNRSGANAAPEFARMSPRSRRAMVEGIEAIMELHAQRPKQDAA